MALGQARTRTLYVLLVALLFAAGYLCFELGRFEAGFSMLDQRRDAAALMAKIDQERATNDELRRQLAIAQTSGEIDRETYSQVESNLGDLQAKIQAQEEELAFYRGIVSPQDGVAGLRIQSLEALPTDAERRYQLRLVLVQAIVHSRRVSGTVKLRIEGLKDGQMASFDVAELVSGDAAYDMAYQFRYFQGLEAELALPLGFEPQRINVEIWPSEARAERVNQTFEWSAIAG
jgi:Family of unknown function (DUF6776)